jgi:hypothetical protein
MNINFVLRTAFVGLFLLGACFAQDEDCQAQKTARATTLSDQRFAEKPALKCAPLLTCL